ncbi:MAG: histidinol-phosphate aminotransferase family protein [Sinobacteraceae bacterium]|nr:histidinol-phosphate aminotransferase family protein [Nevskiaceae bacterium]
MNTGDMDRRRLLSLALAAAALPAAGEAVARKAQRAPMSLRYPLRLSANENPWGPGPQARAAIIAATDDACRYGLSLQAPLAQAIAAKEGVGREQIVIGSGSGELLHMLALGWCSRGEVVCPWPTFNQLMSFAEKLGAGIKKVPLDAAMKHDLPALAAATSPNTSLLYVCNPNNPTGTVIDGPALRAFCSEMAQRTLVVVDEAYLELVDEGMTSGMIDLVREGANVVVLRTFSKLHGLAGLRIGYALARPDVAARLRQHWMTSPSVLGLAAATASLGDTEFLTRTRAALITDRRRVTAACDELGLAYAPPQGNFVFLRPGMPVNDFREKMKAKQIEVGRSFEPLREWCRVSVGTTDETTVFIDALRAIVKG